MRMACCVFFPHANTAFPKSLCCGYPWGDKISKHPEFTTALPHPRPICLKRFGWAAGQARSAGVRAAGESMTHLLPFSHPCCSFSRIRCAVSLTCDHLASCVTWTAPEPQGGDPLHGTIMEKEESTNILVTWWLLASFSGTVLPGAMKHSIIWKNPN